MVQSITRNLKLFYLISIIFTYILICLPFLPVACFSENRYRKFSAILVSFVSKRLLGVLGVYIEFKPEPIVGKDNFFIVSNHLSYLDALILSACFPGCFITSQEVRETFFLGHLTRLAACIFVERRSRRFLGLETANITQALKAGLNILIFPEGTSTNGDGVLRFRQPLFQAAIDSNKDIIPLTLSYEQINHAPVNQANRDLVFWYGDMTFWDHFKKLAEIHHVRVRLSQGNRLVGTKSRGREELSVRARSEVTRNFHPIVHHE
jgi:1-acyl-sn-glycerol-3-phosphate acyltransferase